MAQNSVRYKHNRLQQLRGFCYAAQNGSISKAAKKMFLSQPSVSLQIQGVAETGVDYISIGALTKDAIALDLSMRLL